MSLELRFAALFAGREGASGTESGGCVTWGPDYIAHLHGTDAPIGVYPMVPTETPDRTFRSPAVTVSWRVKWGCIDLDVKGPTHATGYDSAELAHEAALNLCTALRALGITGWVERTKSGGYHVWVFAAEWVPAATMRRALLVACAVVEVPPTEVNPKSEGFDDAATLGNYVRLPYPGVLGGVRDVTQHRLVINQQGVPYSLDLFLTMAEQALASPAVLAAAAALHVVPHERKIEFEGEVELDAALQKRLGGLAFTILRDGPLDGGDRSGALFKLAHCCREDDLNAEEALAVVTAADLAWGKYHLRHDAERYLRQTVERAWR